MNEQQPETDAPGRIEAQGRRVVDLFGACAAAPDDLAVARSADEALVKLEEMLVAADQEDGRADDG
ncbi:hypothetical protein [Spirillospora sp. NPDC048819]|uniref:hypothetical protein n=1 Tax=Spirillospora sp. NPDC048819 TaxID=3155268 RepID=UPI0033EEC874